MKTIRAKKITRKNLFNFLKLVSQSLNIPDSRKKMQTVKIDDNDWNWHYSY